MPGCRTLPATSTVTVPGAAPRWAAGRAGTGHVADRLDRGRDRDQSGRPGRGQRGSVVRRPAHQPPAGDREPDRHHDRDHSQLGGAEPGRTSRASKGVPPRRRRPRRRRPAGVWAPVAAEPVVGAAPRAWCARPTTGRSSGRWRAAAPAGPSARPDDRRTTRRRAGPAGARGPRRARRFVACAWVEPRKIRHPPRGRTDGPVDNPADRRSLWTTAGVVRQSGRGDGRDRHQQPGYVDGQCGPLPCRWVGREPRQPFLVHAGEVAGIAQDEGGTDQLVE